LGASQSVRARHSAQSAAYAPELQIFEPFRMNTSPSRVARVVTPARSDPPRGSDRNCTMTSSPRSTAGRCWRFCSSLPMSSTTGAQMEKVGMFSTSGIS
jgi:hypothetical protein